MNKEKPQEEKEKRPEEKKMRKIKCNCPCHKGMNIKHFQPCCDNGYIKNHFPTKR